MRSLFTQFSLLLGVLVALNMNAEATPLFASISWGLITGGMVYLMLLLGDFSIHRLLDSSANKLTSVQFRQQPIELEMFEDLTTTNQPSTSVSSSRSEKEQLAA